ncbi:HAMP domain-containing sensor histidine kinase [Streptomyces griseorubiginosus]|uniref:HAMP domain-containing sensor histidine kinase n=1 Tax=Streptomyces griseorubiginosus TaxID=67304 RepID=UPI00076D228B|nr:HAMP domain-containing sensor histidine kinase [Streptomyces griseorubiginosus]KUM80618.1 kinase [Streptomyces griseorubiginosus]
MAAERRARTGGRAAGPGRLPWRRSLLVRLLAASITIAVCSVAATAWLAARTTTSALQREQGQVLADDARIYDTLMGYAAAHTDWSAVAPALARLAERTGRHITLTTQDRRPVAVSGPASQDLPTRASALVDPLRADPALLPGVQADGIDPRAVGPYRLPAAERKQLSHLARTLRTCLRGTGFSAGVTEGASGRPSLVMTGDTGIQRKVGEVCGVFALDEPTRTEKRALDRLNALVGGCLKRQGLDPVVVGLGFAPAESVSEPVRRCVDTARREQLAPYVAPPVLLFVASAAGSPAAPGFDLSSANTAKVAGVAALVLVLTLAVTVTVGTRLVRPLRALTDAARHPTQEHLRVPVTTHDEIGHLAAAFNDLSERRERLEEQRKAMVSDVAHELRTPLTTIRGWLEAAQDGLAASDEAFVASLLEEALLLQHIVDDLQHLAQADAGRLRLHAEPVSPRDLLDQVAAAHRGRAETAGVTLTTRIENAPTLYADPARLRQTVGNLLSNAIRHTPAGGTVTLGCRGEGEEIVIEVADTGTGIAAADLPRVFDRFWRADRARGRQTGGSGLGLAIVRQLTEAHGGTVTVTSTPGTETVFTLRLPATPDEALLPR